MFSSTFNDIRFRWQCQIDSCGAQAYRFCRVCLAWVCSAHRFGAGWWFRCPYCDAGALAKLWREAMTNVMRCDACGEPFERRQQATHATFRPRCACERRRRMSLLLAQLTDRLAS